MSSPVKFQLSSGRVVYVSDKGIRLGSGAYRADAAILSQTLASMPPGDRRRCRKALHAAGRRDLAAVR